jgi:carbon-monoxide dehydrogenase catalytic subunit
MEFIQKKTADPAVEHFLPIAAEEEISLVWDRYEGQLPECGFCETGLSCRDCLQGPCISHPFRDSNKVGVCGKDKDILASQSLLRLVMKGTMTYLDRLMEFAEGVKSGKVTPKKKTETIQIMKEIQGLLNDGGAWAKKEFPRSMTRRWEEANISPEGMVRDLLKTSQKLEGGVADAEELLLWTFKSSLLGFRAQSLYGRLKRSVFGDSEPTKIVVNLGALRKDRPNLLLCGHFSPFLKRKIAEVASKKDVNLVGVCTDPVLPPYAIPPATNYGSQEIPLMTGAVDLIVAGDRWVNPSLASAAMKREVPIVPTEVLKRQNLDRFANEIVEKAKKSFEFRRNIPRDIPEHVELALVGLSVRTVDTKKIVNAIHKGMIKGIALLSGSNNVKYTQDKELVTIAEEFLKNDILCLSEGEASIGLAKYGFLNPNRNGKEVGRGLSELLASLGKNLPAILDFGGNDNGLTSFLFDLSKHGKKEARDYPLLACFAEASRSSEVTEAMWMVAMGVRTYFWPALSVTGSRRVMMALSDLCQEKFGSRLYVMTDKKMEPRAKADQMMKDLQIKKSPRLSGYSWK